MSLILYKLNLLKIHQIRIFLQLFRIIKIYSIPLILCKVKLHKQDKPKCQHLKLKQNSQYINQDQQYGHNKIYKLIYHKVILINNLM